MAFHDVRLPISVEMGAQGGPRFLTSIIQLYSGHEQRNINWSAQRAEWNIAYGIDDATFIAVRAHFYNRRSAAHSFPFRDWSDYQIGSTGSPQTIGTGDGSDTTFQIVKTYNDGTYSYSRDITKPVTAGFSVYVNGVLKTVTTDYAISRTTGVITFTSPPTMGHAIAVIGEFDVPVRYGADAFDVLMHNSTLGAVPSLTLIEVKGE